MVAVTPLVIWVAERWCRAWKKHLAHPENAMASSEVEEVVADLAAQKQAVQPQIPGLDAGADRLTRRLAP